MYLFSFEQAPRVDRPQLALCFASRRFLPFTKGQRWARRAFDRLCQSGPWKMVSNKNQHYVPRCYLRAFTEYGDGARINLFNIDRRRVIPLVSTRHQCAKDYFYAADPKLETAIQLLERSYAEVLRRIMHDSYVLIDEDSDLLRKFWLFQYLRTEAASRRFVQALNDATDAMGLSGAEYRAELGRAVLSAMRTFAEEMDIMDDMAACLVRNVSEKPFITSDDPAVLSNRLYLEFLPRHGRSFGLSQSGNIMILPLTPSILFLGYDRNIYTVRVKKGWTTLRVADDARAYNEHQMLNCRANIFFRDSCYGPEVESEFAKIADRRPPARHQIHALINDRSQGDNDFYRVVEPEEAQQHGEMMVLMEAVYPTPARWPIHLDVKVKGTVFANGTGSGYLRRPRIRIGSQNSFRKETIRLFRLP